MVRHVHNLTPMEAASLSATNGKPLHTPASEKRALRILAKSVYRELVANGHTSTDIVAFTSELIDVMREELSNE